MRILICTDHYPPFIGGAHRWADRIAHGLADRGHEVAVATPWHGGLPRLEAADGVTVHRIRQLRTASQRLVKDTSQRHMPPFPDPISMFDLDGVVRRFSPEVAVVHGWMAASAAPVLARRHVPVLLSTHDYGYFCATRTLRYRGTVCSGPAANKCPGCAADFYGGKAKGWVSVAGVALLKRLLRRRVTATQTVSTFVDQMLWQNVVRRMPADTKRFIIPAFVDDDPPPTPAEQRRISEIVAELPTDPFILFVGALREIKGVDVLLEAYRRLTERPRLVLMGTVHHDTPTDLPAGVSVVEDAPHLAVMEGWKRALVGVVPSVWPDPCPTVAIECASQGTPVVGTTPGGMSDTVGDEAGVLVPMGDAPALARALDSIIGDPTLRARLSSSAVRKAAGYTGEIACEAYERALESLLAG